MKPSGNDYAYILLVLVFGVAFLLAGGFSYGTTFSSSSSQNQNLPHWIPVEKKGASPNSNLQIDQLKFIQITPVTQEPPQPSQLPSNPPSASAPISQPTPTPKQNTPGGYCVKEQLITNGCHCDYVEDTGPQAGQPASWQVQCTGGSITNGPFSGNHVSPKWCNNKSDGLYCVGKPVIYLYPIITTTVNVKLSIPGFITESIPFYPPNGWKNITAYPGGTLKYKNQIFNELYYESAVPTIHAPDSGTVIPSKTLRPRLLEITRRLGLIPNEQQEFLDYWLPRLRALNAPYILFSVLPYEEKDRVDHVEITPNPDTMIEFLAYFKPLQKNEPIKPLALPENPPQRIGFTAVEWGGTIDTH